MLDNYYSRLVTYNMYSHVKLFVRRKLVKSCLHVVCGIIWLTFKRTVYTYGLHVLLYYFSKTILSSCTQENIDIYATKEPQEAFHQRILFCLELHSQSVKVRNSSLTLMY